jgi:23S rRNA U2552 (ribose-2'-O)-methylase RlmE/FtsJ
VSGKREKTAREIAGLAIGKKGATQKITELSPLLSLLKRRKLRTVVEIGTAQGGTFYAWCKIAEPGALIVSIDLPHGPFGGGYTLKDIKKFRKYKRKGQKLYFLRRDSHRQKTKRELIGILHGRKIDFLFIDGDHRYAGVRRDFQLYSPLVKENGLIVFHDILFHPRVQNCKVDKFWNEVKNRFKYVEYIDRKDDRGWGQWGGIGVIRYVNQFL